MREGYYIIAGYLAGSILFASVFGQLFCHKDITEESKDHNPGTANAFMYGGFLCGVLTLCCDLLKGFLPVYAYFHEGVEPGPLLWVGLVIAAPVAGHIFSVFHRFCGGKGIAVSFGCLLGLLPDIGPVLLLAVNFIFFSLVIRVTPHYYRTVCTYGFTVLGALLMIKIPEFRMGILMIAILIQGKLAFSQEKKEKCRVSVLWKS